jgi:hypothetical protein
MKEVAILLLLALMLNGCGTTTPNAQAAASGGWEAQMSGGVGTSSGFSFIAQFTVGDNGALSFSNFQFLNQQQDTCFGTDSITESGMLDVTFNSADQVTGTFSFTITSSAGDAVTLSSSDVTGTINTTTNSLTNGSITGTWTLAPGTGTGCVATSGTFTMTQTS